jgi:hypothetical protein
MESLSAGGVLIRAPAAFSTDLVEHLIREGLYPSATIRSGTLPDLDGHDEISVDLTTEEARKSVARFGKALRVDDDLIAWARAHES